MNISEEIMARDQIIVRTSIIGIITNVLLAGFKAAVGILSHSIAIALDAVNNLSDALSSLITIIGTKLAGKLPNKKHPYGYGRIEYLTAGIIAMIVLYAGITSLVESVKKIIHPTTPDYAPVTLIIVAVAVVVKIVLGLYVKKVGKSVNSDSLVASGEDAKLDAVISASTLVAALIYLFAYVSVESYLGVIISAVIIKSGLEMLSDTLSQIMGERLDAKTAREIKRTVTSFKNVRGAYDLSLHNYGPDRLRGSIHIEVPDTMTASEIDTLTREIQNAVLQKYAVIIEAVSVYSYNTKDPKIQKMHNDITSITKKHKEVLQMHGFYVNEETHSISYDIVFDFDAENTDKIYKDIYNEIKNTYPDYTLYIALDTDISE